MKNNKILMLVGMLLVLVLLISFASAYRLVCLSYGQSIPITSTRDYTCWHDQCINICVTDEGRYTNPGHCYGMGGCEIFGEPEFDVTPPSLIVNSPVNEEICDSRSVLFDLEFDEPSTIYWMDNVNGRGRWKRICSNCEDSYLKKVRFKDGESNITIKAKDRNNNYAEVVRNFFVDSKKPKIYKTYPKKGFADGLFEVQFKEENPEELVLNYGNSEEGYREKILDFEENRILSEEDSCYVKRGKHYCNVQVDLGDYDGQEIEYWFELEDIAGNVVESKHVLIKVDETEPEILNDPFYTQGVGRYNKYIYFDIEIGDENFDEVGYRYVDSRGREKFKRLCSRLRNGRCVKRKSFRRGHYDLTLEVYDKAGNMVGQGMSFDVV